jgi:hypothetical protein
VINAVAAITRFPVTPIVMFPPLFDVVPAVARDEIVPANDDDAPNVNEIVPAFPPWELFSDLITLPAANDAPPVAVIVNGPALSLPDTSVVSITDAAESITNAPAEAGKPALSMFNVIPAAPAADALMFPVPKICNVL